MVMTTSTKCQLKDVITFTLISTLSLNVKETLECTDREREQIDKRFKKEHVKKAVTTHTLTFIWRIRTIVWYLPPLVLK